MALQTLPGSHGCWVPTMGDDSYSINASTLVIDATGEYVALICRVPKTGTLTRFEAPFSAVSNAPDNGLRFSFQDVDLTTGLPDGVVDQFATTAAGTPSAPGWVNPGDFNATRSVTRGDLIACVIDAPSFTAGDSVAVGGTTRTSDLLFPYGVSATGTKQQFTIPMFGLRYDDGTYEAPCTEVWPATSNTDRTVSSSTTPDEYGIAFQLPFPFKLSEIGIFMLVGTNADYTVYVYDASDNVLASIAVDGSVTSSTSARRYSMHYLSTEITGAANTLYRVTFKPGTTTSHQLTEYTFASLALMGAVEGGSNWYSTGRKSGGAWTNYNNSTDGFKRCRISLNFTAFDDGTAVGGGGGAALSRVRLGM